jgi:hypothetical protein
LILLAENEQVFKHPAPFFGRHFPVCKNASQVEFAHTSYLNPRSTGVFVFVMVRVKRRV